MKNSRNVVLIGMPSSGKSTAGVLLAKKIGYGFMDCDLIIQGEEGKLLPELISERGAEGFIGIENRILKGISAQNCVVATGGSAVYSDEAMRHLKTIGTVVYLKIPETEVERRIRNFERRGIVMRGNVTTLKELYAERAPLYEQYADVVVEGRKRIEDTVAALAEAVGFRG